MKPRADETLLIGKWLATEHGVVADDVAKRIESLTKSHLKHLAADATGWDRLYLDPDDGRLWELTYPHGDWHGGGPPRLEIVSGDYAREKYGWTGG